MLTSLEQTGITPRPDFEQLRRALMREGVPEYVPFYELFANVEVMEPCLGRKIENRSDVVEFYWRAGYDYVPTWAWPPMVLGNLIDRRQPYPITDWQSLDAYQWPDPDSINYTEFDVTVAMLRDGMKMIGQWGGIFETAEKLLGYEQLCLLLADDPDLVQAVFDHLGVMYEAMYSAMASHPDVGAVVISDDLGFKTQTMIAPDDLRKYVLPWHKRLAEIGHAAGKPVILHCCGNLSQIMEDIIEDVRVDAKHSYEDSILPVTDAKRIYGDRVAILGGFDVDRLCRSTEEEVRAYTRMLITECGRGGGYALGSGNSIAPFVPVQNYLAMLDEAWTLRR